MQLPVVKKTCRVEKEEGSEGNSGTAVRDPGFDSKCSHALEYSTTNMPTCSTLEDTAMIIKEVSFRCPDITGTALLPTIMVTARDRRQGFVAAHCLISHSIFNLTSLESVGLELIKPLTRRR
jgi:hypothetical protein